MKINWDKVPWTLVFFCAFCIVICISTCVAINKLSTQHQERQEIIINTFQRSHKYKDDLYRETLKQLNDTANGRKANLNAKQLAEIKQDLKDNIKNDSSTQIKELLDLEFNKIQSEYDELAVWVGILMVVFLIFSFYSLIKTDEMSKQSREALKEILQVKKDVDEEKDGISKKISDAAKTAATEATNQIEPKVTKLTAKIETERSNYESKIESVEKKIKEFNKDLNRDIENFRSSLNSLNSEKEKLIMSINDNQNKITQIQETTEKDFKQEAEDIIERIKSFANESNQNYQTQIDDLKEIIDGRLAEIESRISELDWEPIGEEDLDQLMKNNGLKNEDDGPSDDK